MMMLMLTLFVLAFSLFAIYQAITSNAQSNFENSLLFIGFGSLGVLLATSSLVQMRRKILAMRALATRVITVILCNSCDFKMQRDFVVGDYVYKEVGQCQQCKGTTSVNVIYAEEPKKGS